MQDGISGQPRQKNWFLFRVAEWEGTDDLYGSIKAIMDKVKELTNEQKQ